MLKFDLFPGGKQHVLTMSYDDGREEDRKLVEIFNRYGIKGTFHLNSDFLDQPGYIRSSEVKSLYENHEVSSHTASHARLTDLPRQEVIREILQDKANLEQLCGYPVRGMSLPGGDRNSEVDAIIRSCGMCYCRTSEYTMDWKLPDDFIRWKPSCHHKDAAELARYFINAQGKSKNFPQLYIMGHSYEFSAAQNWDLIEQLCDMLGGLEDTWYATNIEIYDYYMAQRSLRFTSDHKVLQNPS